MKKEAIPKLRFGPYEPPAVRRGDWLMDEIHGLVKVGGWGQRGRIAWPRRWGSAALILCGSLVDAIKSESAASVGYWWGISGKTVARLRSRLGVTVRNNAGSLQACIEASSTPERLEKLDYARQLALAPAVRAKIASSRRANKQAQAAATGAAGKTFREIKDNPIPTKQ
jgi:hypothetical protein